MRKIDPAIFGGVAGDLRIKDLRSGSGVGTGGGRPSPASESGSGGTFAASLRARRFNDPLRSALRAGSPPRHRHLPGWDNPVSFGYFNTSEDIQHASLPSKKSRVKPRRLSPC